MRPFANDQTTAEAFSQLTDAVLSVLNFSSYIKKIRSLSRKYGLNVWGVTSLCLNKTTDISLATLSKPFALKKICSFWFITKPGTKRYTHLKYRTLVTYDCLAELLFVKQQLPVVDMLCSRHSLEIVTRNRHLTCLCHHLNFRHLQPNFS